MKLPPTAGHVRQFLLLAGLILQAPLAVAQTLPPAAPARLTVDARHRLTEAARDPKLASWQREFMQGLARDGVEGVANRPSPARPAVSQQSSAGGGGDGSWVSAPQPSARFCHTMIYDPVRERMVVLGGYDGGYRNDVWVLTLTGSPAWSQLFPTGTAPTPRNMHGAVYDPVRDRLLVFGGFDNAFRNDVWALDLSGGPAWSELTPSGTPPSPRAWHAAIYDPVRDRLLMIGGRDSSQYYNDVWALTLAGSPEWSEVTPLGAPPVARFCHTAIYDAPRDRVVLFGGDDGVVSYLNDVWSLPLSGSPEWSELTPAGTPPNRLSGQVAVYDSLGDRMVVFGGYDGTSFRNDAWAMTLSETPEWTDLTPTGTMPTARGWGAAIFDPVSRRLVAFGGEINASSVALNDVQALTLTESPSWNALSVGGARPSGRYCPAAIYDPVRDRMVVFGGSDGSSRNDAWGLSLQGIPTWSDLTPSGTPPAGRFSHTAIYDPVRDRMVVFGGQDFGGCYDDAWALTLSGSPTWSDLAPTGTPPSARIGHTAVYDPVGDRMVVFGGHDSLSYYNDTWVLTLSEPPTWSELTPTGTLPTGRFGHTAIYDPGLGRIIVFGGYDGSGYYNDAWALTISESPEWSELTPIGTPPDARHQQSAIYDATRSRMVVFGGRAGASYYNDAWQMTLSGSPEWSQLAPTGGPPPGRYGPVAIYHPALDRMVAFGGDGGGYPFLNDVWMLGWENLPVSVPPGAGTLARRFELSLPRPNPSRGRSVVDFELLEPARVLLDVFDTQGRRVKQLADGWFTAGRHALAWQGDDEGGHALGTGVYFVRMQGSGFQATRRTMIIR